MAGPVSSDGRERLVLALAQVADGDQLALREVYDSTCAKLFGVCLRICQDREAAEDVLQNVYIEIWHRAGRFDGTRASPVTWLCAIARNAAIDWRRANGTVHLPESAAAAVADTSPLAPGGQCGAGGWGRSPAARWRHRWRRCSSCVRVTPRTACAFGFVMEIGA
jgi:RNA polymerase sigma factor (sigma-70 family)